MIFNSFGFLSLFPIIFIIYYLTPAFMSKICKGKITSQKLAITSMKKVRHFSPKQFQKR